MAHQAQKDFFNEVKEKYPDNFSHVEVLDCGSLDVNGTLKDMFEDSEYIGVDIADGKNVNIISSIQDLLHNNLEDINFYQKFDTVVSGEMLEHDETWKESLQAMYDMTKPGGLIAFSCAGKGRREHGTARTSGRARIWGTSPDYYMNLEEEHVKEIYKDEMFTDIYFGYNDKAFDLYFYGLKK